VKPEGWILVYPPLAILLGAALSAYIAYRAGRNLVLAIRRERPWPLVAAWTAVLTAMAAFAAGLAYAAWAVVARVSQYNIGPP
jgi:hypothetical protein